MDAIQDNLLTSSDYEDIMQDLKSGNHFQQIPPLAVQHNIVLEENRGTIDTFQPHRNPPQLESYIGVDIHEALKHIDAEQSTDPTDLPLQSVSPTGTIPCRENFPGPLNFEILLDSTTANRRSWIYSHKLNKVFIDMNKALLIQFRVQGTVDVPLCVRALPVYSMADFVSVPVQRCDIHILNDDSHHQSHSTNPPICFCAKFRWVRHVVRSGHSQATYDYDCESDRHSVVIPLDTPQPGSDTVVAEYHFACKTSCPRGMNRKPIDIVFTLETEQCQVIGRYVMPIKICGCPKLSKEKEEGYASTNNDPKSFPPGKRRMSSAEKVDASKKFKSEQNSPVNNEGADGDNDQQNLTNLMDVIKQQPSQIAELGSKITLKQEEDVQQRVEISRQREEIARQREEIALQREEITRQREEITRQREEIALFRNESCEQFLALGTKLDALCQLLSFECK